jgi:hydrogenase expression/formation protein HypC
MCLGVPGRIDFIDDADGVAGARRGRVDFGGVQREVALALVPEANVGDYVIVHAGIAITRLDEAQAAATLALLGELAAPGTKPP